MDVAEVTNSELNSYHVSHTKIKWVRYEFVTAVSMKMTVFRVVAPCRLVQVYLVLEVLAASVIMSLSSGPWWWRWQGPLKCCKFLPDYTALQPRTQPSSEIEPFPSEELKIMLNFTYKLFLLGIAIAMSYRCHVSRILGYVISLQFFPFFLHLNYI
jgi:hydrogenase-4 membrane subunit HyfE